LEIDMAAGWIAVEQRVPVPLTVHRTGVCTVGDLRPGDHVLSPAGQTVNVLCVEAPVRRPAYSIELDTGERITCDAEFTLHTMTAEERRRAAKLNDDFRARRRATRASRAKAVSKKPWVSRTVTSLNQARRHDYLAPPTGKARSVSEIAETLLWDRREMNHSVAVSQPFEMDEANLWIPPYLLGLWLGDGYAHTGMIGMSEEDFRELLPHLPEPSRRSIDPRPSYKRPFLTCRWEGLTAELRRAGLISNKHVPPAYLRASRAQRVALLQGLLDTDGSCDTRGQISIGLSDRNLMNGVLDLVCGLGVKAAMSRRGVTLNGRALGDAWGLKFVAPFPAFRLPRKLIRQKLEAFRPTTTRRYVVGVKEHEPLHMTKLAVAGPGGAFVLGDTFIPVLGQAAGSDEAMLDAPWPQWPQQGPPPGDEVPMTDATPPGLLPRQLSLAL
jgi:replicative DNA helicase